MKNECCEFLLHQIAFYNDVIRPCCSFSIEKNGLFKKNYSGNIEGIKEYWGGIINMGASTVWEEFDPNMKGTEHYAMYGEPFDKSLCHAWGAGPIYFIGRYLVGLHPTDAGYKSFELEPKLNVGNYKVTLPVMNGCIKIEVKDSTLTVVADVDGGVLKAKGKTIELKKNEHVNVY